MRMILSLWASLFWLSLYCQPTTISPFIKVDQFGYLCNSRKIAVISDPVTGFNASEFFSPGTATDAYQVRKWNGDDIVMSGTISAWNGGAVHAQSGDRGWYFDFSAVTEPGIYYVWDNVNQVGSGQFFIGSNAYDANMRAVLRTYYYARCNFEKSMPYTERPEYNDVAAYERSNQDKHARSSLDKNNPSTERDVSGGWFDAGDMNKYVTFAALPMLTLMDSYYYFPQVFGDNNNIPESGNGMADILDEVKWELLWLMKMQDGTGTNGLFLKVGVDSYNCTNSPPSADVCPRYYIPECTSSTIAGAAIFAAAYRAYSGVAGQGTFAADMLARAQSAWTRATVTTSGWTNFATGCDNGDIKSGDADWNSETQKMYAMAAAIYLYAATGNNAYKTYVESNYASLDPVASGWWGPYDVAIGRAVLYYATLPGVSATVSNNILNSKAGSYTGMGLSEYQSGTDLYRSHMPNSQYHWGSNEVKAYIGAQQGDFVKYNLNPGNHTQYRELAEQYLHYFHGINPLGIVYMSNMYPLHAESCINEFYNGWFGDGTPYDNTQSSQYAATPGYIPGGPNASFTIPSIAPPAGQPPQKAYKDWNTGWNASTNMNENSWEITENSIYVQAAYVSLLATVLGLADNLACTPVILATRRIDFSAARQGGEVVLRWNGDKDVVDYQVQMSLDGKSFHTIQNFSGREGMFQWTDRPAIEVVNIYYRLKIMEINGRESFSSVRTITWPDHSGFEMIMDNAYGVLTIRMAGDNLLRKFDVRIFNATGTLIFHKKDNRETELNISTDGWPSGVYFVQMTGGNYSSEVRKIFVAK